MLYIVGREVNESGSFHILDTTPDLMKAENACIHDEDFVLPVELPAGRRRNRYYPRRQD